MDSIKFPNSHHARVNLVVQLQREYGDQHGAYCLSLIRDGTEMYHCRSIQISDSHFRTAKYAVMHTNQVTMRDFATLM